MARTDKGKKKPRWSKEDDEKLVTLRQTKLRSWKQVGKALKRTPEACAMRYSNMTRGKIPMPVIGEPTKKPPAVEVAERKFRHHDKMTDEAIVERWVQQSMEAIYEIDNEWFVKNYDYVMRSVLSVLSRAFSKAALPPAGHLSYPDDGSVRK